MSSQTVNGQPANYNASPATRTSGDASGLEVDSVGNLRTVLSTLLAGEDLANDVQKVEQRFSSSGVLATDTLVKTGVGLLHTITIACNDSAPTAGNVDIYDNTTNSGTKLFSTAFTTTYFLPVTLLLDTSFAIGLYMKFTTTADVNVVLSYR